MKRQGIIRRHYRTKILFPKKEKNFPKISFLKIFLISIGKPIFWLIFNFFNFLYQFFLFSKEVYFKIICLKIAFRIKALITKISPRRIPHPHLPPLKLKIKIRTIFFFLLLIGLSYFLLKIFSGLPNPNRLLTHQPLLSTKIYDRNGNLLYKIYRKENRTLTKINELPLYLIQATIAIEDAEFYSHHGFSIKGIIRAGIKNILEGKLYGGSTITQQLVKNILLTPQRTLIRKIKEIILAVLVETKFSKNEILQMYLNEVGYGGATYGIEEAAQTYFGKSAKNLDLAEAALLAGLPASPTLFSPFGAHPEKAKERQLLVLRRMKEEGFITEKEEKEASRKELQFAPQRIDIKAPHFVMYIKEILVQKYGERIVEEGGLEVKTSLDLGIQEYAQNILREEIKKLRSLRINNGAILVTKPATGEILAMVGSENYFDLDNDGNVNVTLRPRQPGSAIKPIMYSVALENGFTPATILSDTPITYKIPNQPPYSPKNYDNRFHGDIPLRVALASSYNVPAVKVLAALGVEKMIKRGQEMGITTWDDSSRFGLSLALGGGEVKMIDLAVAYGVLANLGKRVDLQPILEIKNFRGEILKDFQNSPKNYPQVISPEVAFLLTDILSDNNARAPAFGLHSWLNVPNHPSVAVKTGTTQNLRDNWTIGYTPDFLVAVWVGNNDNKPMSWVASGVTGASPIWNKVMSWLLKDIPDKKYLPPPGIVKMKVCNKEEYFIAGTSIRTQCSPTP